jgi:hypothetical protein
MFGVALCALAASVACGGGDDDTESVSQTPTASPYVLPTATPLDLGTPPPPGKPLEDIVAEEQFAVSDPDLVTAAYGAAYAAHPDAGTINAIDNNQPFPRQYADNNLEYCQFGQPPFGADPALRAGSCGIMLVGFLSIYDATGYGEFYQAAVVTYNFALTTLPEQTEQINANLQNFFQRRASLTS